VTAALGTFPGTTLGVVPTLLSLNQIDFALDHVVLLDGEQSLSRAADRLDKVAVVLSAASESAVLGEKFTQLALQVLALSTHVKPGANLTTISTDAKALAKKKDTLIAELPSPFGIAPTELATDVQAIDHSVYYLSILADDGVKDPARYVKQLDAATAAKQKLEAAARAAVAH
jgi:hypothetical protein